MAPPPVVPVAKEPSPLPVCAFQDLLHSALRVDFHLQSPKRNIMSFSSILASDTRASPPTSPKVSRNPPSQSPSHIRTESDMSAPLLPSYRSPVRDQRQVSATIDTPITNGLPPQTIDDLQPTSPKQKIKSRPPQRAKDVDHKPSRELITAAPKPKPPINIPEKAYLAEISKLNEMELRNGLSDPDDTGFEDLREAYVKTSSKRAADMEVLEARKCKVSSSRGLSPFALMLTSS